MKESNYIHLMIQLNSPREAVDGLLMSFLFSQQPTAQELFDAFDRDPRLYLREHAATYRSMLVNGVQTFGIPKLDIMSLRDDKGRPLEIPRVTCEWAFNALSREHSIAGSQMGSISVAYLQLNDNTPEPVVQLKSKQKKEKVKK